MGVFTLLAGLKLQKKLDLININLLRLAERQLVKAREAETALLVKLENNISLLIHCYVTLHQVERTRKANQFSATESTCRHTLASLMPTLMTQVRENLNTEAVTALLRSKPGPEEKLKLWERLKVTFELNGDSTKKMTKIYRCWRYLSALQS